MDKDFAKTNIKIKFKGEIGIDYGGISREWVTMLVKEITNQNLGLFELSVNKRSTQPSVNSCHLYLSLIHI